MVTAYISHPDCELHEMEPGHPESPQRLLSIKAFLQERDVWKHLKQIKAPKAEKSDLYRVHRRDYVEQMFAMAPKRGMEILGEDVVANKHTLDAALRSSGAVKKAVDVVMAGKVDNAFCAVRPPGHHAERGKAMGFCVFNNIAVGAAYALSAYQLERIAIVDFDVHHGNGTEDTLHLDSRILFCSSFQHPFYPFTVPDSSRSNVVHLPLHAGTSGEEFREWVQQYWMPRLNHFSPQLLMISAGFDAHQADPLADIYLDERDYRWVTQELKMIADQHCEGRIISVLEGGYDLTALSRSVCAHIKVLANLP